MKLSGRTRVKMQGSMTASICSLLACLFHQDDSWSRLVGVGHALSSCHRLIFTFWAFERSCQPAVVAWISQSTALRIHLKDSSRTSRLECNRRLSCDQYIPEDMRGTSLPGDFRTTSRSVVFLRGETYFFTWYRDLPVGRDVITLFIWSWPRWSDECWDSGNSRLGRFSA